MAQTGKQIFEHAIRTKWPYKKHTHASINKIYEIRGRLNRKLRVWTRHDGWKTPALRQYRASKRIAKRVTSGYNRWHAGG